MNCWHCKTEFIWKADHDINHEDETYEMVTNLECPNCYSAVDVYLPKTSEVDHKLWSATHLRQKVKGARKWAVNENAWIK